MPLDVEGYLTRIGFTGPLRPDRSTLVAVHSAHATHVPFENLDIQMGLPIRLDLPSLEDKIVRRRRGGYCFEQNTLLLAVLREIGFDVVACEARVIHGDTPTGRTHMLLIARTAGEELLADVGFGGDGLLEPLPMDGAVHEQYGDAYRVVESGAERILQWRSGSGWSDLYRFVPEPRLPIDFEVANHYTSTHPASRFVQTLTAQLPSPGERRVLRNLKYSVRRGSRMEEQDVTRSDVPRVLREQFGLPVADGTSFRALSEGQAASLA